MKRSVVIIALALLLPLSAFAQRTVNGTSIVELAGSVPIADRGAGFSVLYGRYVLDGFWDAGLVADTFVKDFTAPDHSAEYDVVHLSGAYERQWRIISTWNRVFNIYAGGGVFLGVELIDPFNKLDYRKTGDRVDSSSASFLYGASGAVSAELYILPYVSISVTARPKVFGGSNYGRFSAPASAGLRISF